MKKLIVALSILSVSVVSYAGNMQTQGSSVATIYTCPTISSTIAIGEELDGRWIIKSDSLKFGYVIYGWLKITQEDIDVISWRGSNTVQCSYSIKYGASKFQLVYNGSVKNCTKKSKNTLSCFPG
ncbi:MAG: hypothetical protein KIT27_05890 [Legionellales bacterium]|nr:hypothetical protein [Legionellales bacterium]